MFNIDLAVHQWCARVLESHSIKSNKIDELKDHLYCAIEAAREEGLSDQEAFTQAINHLGESDELKKTYNNNLTFLNKLCAFEYGKVGDFATTDEGEKLMSIYKNIVLSQSILWAAAIIAFAIVTRGMEDKPESMLIILVSLSVCSLLSLKQAFKKHNKT